LDIWKSSHDDKVRELFSTIEEMQKKIASLTAGHTKLRGENTELKKGVEKMKRENTAIKTANKSQAAELAALKSQIENLQNDAPSRGLKRKSNAK
jgi:chromosome segregation ATPase